MELRIYVCDVCGERTETSEYYLWDYVEIPEKDLSEMGPGLNKRVQMCPKCRSEYAEIYKQNRKALIENLRRFFKIKTF